MEGTLGAGGVGGQGADLAFETFGEERVAGGGGGLGMEFDFGTLAPVLGPGGVKDAVEDELLVAGVGSELLAEGGFEGLEGGFLAGENHKGFGGEAVFRGVLRRGCLSGFGPRPRGVLGVCLVGDHLSGGCHGGFSFFVSGVVGDGDRPTEMYTRGSEKVGCGGG
ncbi:MAG: hypothetical protein JNK87_38815 [Bryobacterales bacterium]|nr:hypothetical protein [Bryobacterales bacterium]